MFIFICCTLTCGTHTQLVTCSTELLYCTCCLYVPRGVLSVKIIFCEWPSLVPDLSDVGDEVGGEVGVEVVEGR